MDSNEGSAFTGTRLVHFCDTNADADEVELAQEKEILGSQRLCDSHTVGQLALGTTA